MVVSQQRLKKPKMENQNQSPKDQLIERLKTSNNILVTVSKNPSVDQLSAAIGLTIMLNQLDKHATAVFSGEVPNTLEFLKPEETIEKNTDSLRDFIISLDKAKADKLRYKVEDTFVKVFITPYKTSLSESDLIFGQGDFNVDVVVALGVHEKDDLDQAITNHGRILHDAVVATVNTNADGQIGTINWVDSSTSSLSEMLVPVCEALKPNSLDTQIATAFLTGIVAETNRFSNEKTSSDTMNISAKLMSAGANQQLVATKLEEAVAVPLDETPEAEQAAAVPGDGSLEIEHIDQPEDRVDLPDVQPDHQDEPAPEESAPEDEESASDEPSRLILDPPTLGGKLTANSEPEALDPSTDPMTVRTDNHPILTHDRELKSQTESDDQTSEQPAEETQPETDSPSPEKEDTIPEPAQPLAPTFPTPPLVPTDESDESVIPALAPPPRAEEDKPAEVAESTPEPADSAPSVEESDNQPAEEPIVDNQTLTDLEAAVDSPHIAPASSTDLPAPPDAEAALAAAHEALAAVDGPTQTETPAADGQMAVAHDDKPAESAPVDAAPPELTIDPATGEISYPSNLVSTSNELPLDPTAASVSDPTAPPPVPPPMPMPPVMPMAEPPAGNPLDPDNLPPVTS